MSKQAIKNLMLFLFINLLVAVVIIFNDYYTTNHINKRQTQVAQNVAKPSVSYQKTEQPKTNNVIAQQKIAPSAPSSQPQPPQTASSTNKSNEDNICIIMGPFNIEEKGTLDFILSKSKETNLAEVSKKTPYKIYWDLGTDQDIAEKLFKVQKDGAMADPQFELSQNNKGSWIVDISIIRGSKTVVEKLTKDLANKAEKLNAGGTWKYELLKESYYYTFQRFNDVSPNTIKNIDILLKPKKDPC